MHRIDDSFREKKEANRRARRKRRTRAYVRLFATVLVFASCGALAFWFYGPGGLPTRPDDQPMDNATPPAPAFTATILDIPGDPLRIEIGPGGVHSAVAVRDAP